MRSAAIAAAICAAALASGCDSEQQRSIAHPRILNGEVEGADVASFISRQPAQVDFVSERRGFIATGGGAILATADGGAHWARRGRVPALADFDFVSGRRGYALTVRNALLVTDDAGRSWVRLHRFPRARWEDPATLAFVDAEDGWVSRNTALYRTRDAGRTWILLQLPCSQAFEKPVGPSFVDERGATSSAPASREPDLRESSSTRQAMVARHGDSGPLTESER